MQIHQLLPTITREHSLSVLQEGCHLGAIWGFLPEPKHEERQPWHETGRQSQLGEHPQLRGFWEGLTLPILGGPRVRGARGTGQSDGGGCCPERL